jgi:MFS family permease
VVFGLGALLLAFVGIRQTKPQPVASGAPRQSQFTKLLPLYLLAALLFCILFMASTQFSFALRDNGVGNPLVRSLILGTVTVVGALMAFAYGPLQQRLGVLGTFLFGILCMAVALAINGFGLGIDTPFAVIAAALMGVYAGLVIPYLYHTVTEHTDEGARSRAIGAVTAFGFFGGFLNPPVFVALSKELGLRTTFLVAAAILIVVAIGTALKMTRAGNPVPDRSISH